MDHSEHLRRTPLYALHLELGGKMVPFAGYELPVQYQTGILKEHLHTRAAAGLFDVSHMGQATLSGDDPAGALETLTPADVKGLKQGQQRYAVLLNPQGGIKDDFMVSRLMSEPMLHLVVNGATKEGDFAYIDEQLKGRAVLMPHLERALLALQGPLASAVLARQAPESERLVFMETARMNVAGAPALVSRSGYTGEDGFEISLDSKDAERVACALLAESEVLPIGLGARDSLRLEAGLCLYGHDLSEDIDPVTAALTWSIGKRRRETRDFPAAAHILALLASGPREKRVGIRPEGRAPAREGTIIADKTGRTIGQVTSGSFGPSANAPVAMGYVETAFAREGTEVDLLVRGKGLPARITAMPFVPHRYKRG
ncbi:MAG TPA: glycine cleavage system aminomethyltransferase GcvT [Rhizomicrobium sp.]|jgi:aminomethyltransferase|nr:glycine cleavage system aminomethyltransferase GcvT [Rhizomicrobium sp.]